MQTFLYQFLDGKFNGEKYSFTIHKKGENGQALAGAVFAVTADDTGEQVGTITTDENGVGTITGLIKQAYTVKEIQAPTGYVLSEEPIKISKDDFGNDLAISRDVVNQKRKKQALLVKRHGMIMITKMASVHQKSPSIS